MRSMMEENFSSRPAPVVLGFKIECQDAVNQGVAQCYCELLQPEYELLPSSTIPRSAKASYSHPPMTTGAFTHSLTRTRHEHRLFGCHDL